MEKKNSEQGCIKDQAHIKIKSNMPNNSQESPAPSKVPYEDQKDRDVLCNSKIKTENKNLGHGCIKDQSPYPYQDQDAEDQS